jgi:uridine kinase
MTQPFAAGMRPDDLVTLAKNPLVGRLAAQDLGAFLDHLDQIAVTKGTEVLSEGAEGDYMYFILEGEAEVRRGDFLVRVLKPSDHFGEIALIGIRRRAATIVTTTTMRLARLSRSRYLSLATNHPRVALHLLQAIVATLGDDLSAMTDNVANLLGHGVRRRVDVRVMLPDGIRHVGTGTTIESLLPHVVNGSEVVAALVDGKPVSLGSSIVSDSTVMPVTLETWEGREAFRQSAGLLLLEAAARVAPDVEVALRNSVSAGRIVSVRRSNSTGDDPDLRARLEREMARLVATGVAFREEVWSTGEARAQLARQGWSDASALLRTARTTATTLVTCGAVYALRLGTHLPTAKGIGTRLLPHPAGMLLDYGERVAKNLPGGPSAQEELLMEEQRHPRFASEMSTLHDAWLSSLGVTSVGALNDWCVTGEVPRLVRTAEGFHEKQIGRIADAIASSAGKVRVIGIAGPSSSGKTTFIKRLSIQLEVNGIRPKALSLDDYYVDRERTVRDEKGEYDFEAFEAIDLPLLQDQMARLSRGERVRIAKFDFRSGKSDPHGGPELEVGPSDVLLVEGIHGLNPRLYGSSVDRERMALVFIHPQSTLPFDRLTTMSAADMRLLRRIVRDRHQRNYRAADNITRWPSVRRGEMRHIFPFYGNADHVFDSSLVYELGVLKVYADRYLLEVPENDPAVATAWRLRRLVDWFVAIYPDHVPPTSIAREFFGGSGFEY